MKRISSLFLALALCLGLALPASAAESEGFSDVQNHYAKAAVETWSGYGVLKGYPDGSFKPNDPVTRAELAVVLDRVMGYRSAAENTFSDVPERAWYAQSILHLVEEGIFQGRKAGQMMPKSAVTRQEAFAALARAMDVEESGEAPGFTDDGAVAAWAKGCLAAMKEAGYIKGDKNGAIRPDDPITRAELVTTLDRMIPGFVNEDGTYSRDCGGNLVINAQDVRLEDMTVEGDLIVADGVGEGDVYLEKVTVKGDIILRGCGENSFHILPGCDVKNIIVTKTTGGMIRLVNESGKTIPMIFVNDGKAGVTLDGDALGEVVVACDAPVTIAAKSVKTLSVTGGAKLTVSKDATVSSLELAGTAKTAQVTVEGKVSRLTNDAGVKVDKQNGGSVGGSSGSGGSSSGGSGSGGSSSGGSGSGGGSTTTPKTVSEVTLQLLAPAFGKKAESADVLGVGYSAKTEWFNADGSEPSYRWKAPGSTEEDTFTADQAYRAVVTLSPVSGYAFGSALKVNVTDGNGNDFTPVKSEKDGNNWVVTLEYEATEDMPYISRVSLDSKTVVTGKNVVFSVSYADNRIVAPDHTYQWYACTDWNGNGERELSGETGSTYTFVPGTVGNFYYRYKVTVNGKTFESNVATLTVQTPDVEIPKVVIDAYNLELEDTGIIVGSYTATNLVDHSRVMYRSFCTVDFEVKRSSSDEPEIIDPVFYQGSIWPIDISEGKAEKYIRCSPVDILADSYWKGIPDDEIIDVKVIKMSLAVTPSLDSVPVEGKGDIIEFDVSGLPTFHVVGKNAVLTEAAAQGRPTDAITIKTEPAHLTSDNRWTKNAEDELIGMPEIKKNSSGKYYYYQGLTGIVYYTYTEDSQKRSNSNGFYMYVRNDDETRWETSIFITEADLTDLLNMDVEAWIYYFPDPAAEAGSACQDIYVYEVEPTIEFLPINS